MAETKRNVISETFGNADDNTEALTESIELSDYKDRMMGYYPHVIQAISEFRAIIDSEYPEFKTQSNERNNIMNDAYLLTMGEDRVKQWEQVLGIKPLDDSSLSDRRETIAARIRGQGKLNTELISSIVNVFTGGSATSYIKNSTLYVEITPPPGNKQYQFENVRQELAKKVPAHLNFKVSRNYYEWGQVKTTFSTWQDVKNKGTWEDIYLFVPFTT